MVCQAMPPRWPGRTMVIGWLPVTTTHKQAFESGGLIVPMDNVPGTRRGKQIDRYELVRLLGRGGIGEVCLATDTHLRRQVAIKLLPPAVASNRAYLNDFEREARRAVLEHPHILPVHDSGEQ